ncbi:MAG: CDP-alcohol phosphatidyltransferase family protein [Ignavibacteriae bacterium]|nr:CDP-alcohol phosphatidyltransferase family protein [Ignavibacteria bacterium]MBI3363343.1 CDP-alcohol phosphatidyltransferase family protein [Ignavibacteriota bacterium]
MEERIWTFSNALSIVRVLLVVPIAVFLLNNDSTNRIYAAGLILIAALTDLFDGILARNLDQVTEFGKILDPLADKIAVGAVTLILALQTKLPMWYLIMVILRDLLIFLGGLYVTNTKRTVLQSNQAGKWAVTTVAFYLLLVVIDRQEMSVVTDGFLVISSAMLLLSFVLYLKRFLGIVKAKATNV